MNSNELKQQLTVQGIISDGFDLNDYLKKAGLSTANLNAEDIELVTLDLQTNPTAKAEIVQVETKPSRSRKKKEDTALAVSQPNQITTQQPQSITPIEPLQPLSFNHLNVDPINPTATATRIDPALNQFLYQRVSQELDFARQLSQVEATAYELRLTLALQHNGLSTDGTLEEKLTRWNEFLVLREQENQQNQERINQCNAEVNKILSSLGIASPFAS